MGWGIFKKKRRTSTKTKLKRAVGWKRKGGGRRRKFTSFGMRGG